MAATHVALILGAGPRIGGSVAKKFASIGYKVAVVSRTGGSTQGIEGILSLEADFTKPELIPALFDKVKAEFKVYPSVVVYNAGARTAPPVENDMFSTSIEALMNDLSVNSLSAFVAAQQAVRGWETLPRDMKKTFIYTGNIMNVAIIPMAATIGLGMGKSASSYWVGLADKLNSPNGMRFFYADERKADGSLKGMDIDGDAHAEFFTQLANHGGSVPWHATFVKGKGYVEFSK